MKKLFQMNKKFKNIILKYISVMDLYIKRTKKIIENK